MESTTFPTWVKDTLERAAVTFLIAVLALLSADALTGFDAAFVDKLGTAGLVAGAAVLKNAVLPKSGLGLTPLLDVIARSGWSAVQAGATVIAADAGFAWYQATAWQAVSVAALAAAASGVKGYLATRMTTNTVTPASLITPSDRQFARAA